MRRTFNFHQSMFGQMVLLTLVFLGGFTYFIAIKPILDFEHQQQNPMDYTEGRVISDIYELVSSVESMQKISSLEQSEFTRQMLDLNPDFQYFIKNNDEIFSNVEQPSSHFSQLVAQISHLQSISGRADICVNIGYKTPRDSVAGTLVANMNHCDGQSLYYEFSGLDTPLQPDRNIRNYLPEWIWGSSRHFLYAAGGVFIIAVVIIIFNFRSINRVTKVAEAIDERSLNTPLPDQSLPTEVQPLVRAINSMISRVNKTKQQHSLFLSTAAHEMRTPLTVLRGRVDMLDEGPIKDQLVNDIRSLTSMVNQLLKLMRTGDYQELTETVDVVACCKKVISERAPIIIDKGINISFSNEAEKLLVVGDGGLLEVAIANLIDNAVSFSKPNDDISLLVGEDGSLLIADQGPGIPSEKLSKIFSPFAKFPSNRDGHGLGLAIVKAIVSLHGATISAANKPEGGAEFRILFADPSSSG